MSEMTYWKEREREKKDNIITMADIKIVPASPEQNLIRRAIFMIVLPWIYAARKIQMCFELMMQTIVHHAECKYR